MRIALLVSILTAVMVIPTGLATAQQGAYIAYVSSAEEVPRNNSRAEGMASFELAPGATGLRYWLKVDNLSNVQMAHIHIGAPGQNGAIAVWLYPPAPPARLISGVSNGLLQDGTITVANLTGPLQGRTFRDLITAIEAGNAYVNVHTTAFPGGEIRGQMR
ncbi:MAG: CHRD domain-containing protein [Armatimonadota bacterium]